MGKAAQGLGDAERLAAIAEPALGLDLAHLELIRILDRRQRFRKRNRTRAITGHRSSQAERIMRAHQVVAIAKGIELALAVCEAGEVEVAQDFELERAMEALVLALGLRMIRTAMSDPDPEQAWAKTILKIPSVRAMVGAGMSFIYRTAVEKKSTKGSDSRDLQHAVCAAAAADFFVTHDDKLSRLQRRVPFNRFRVMRLHQLLEADRRATP